MQIVNQVKLLVGANRLKAGDKLPSVRNLAEQLIVNPNTVARAYRELETLGLVEAKAGSGAFVSNLGSPLARKQKNKMIQERIDSLLADANHLGISVDALVKMIRQRE